MPSFAKFDLPPYNPGNTLLDLVEMFFKAGSPSPVKKKDLQQVRVTPIVIANSRQRQADTLPLVSVVIPTYRRAVFLAKAIGSVLTQTYQNFEVIVVDDGSDDNTDEVVKSFKDERIHCLQHKTNRGGSAARNTGIGNARGKYIAFLDDDDEWLPEKLDRQIKVLEASPPEVGGVYTAYQRVEKNSGKVLSYRISSKSGDMSSALLRKNWLGSTSSVVVRKECFNIVGLFDENLSSFQDYDMWVRISRDFQFTYIDKPLLTYNIHKGQITKNPRTFQRGLERMIGKLGTRSSALKKNFSNHYVELAVLFCVNGERQKCREACVNAAKLCPFWTKPYIVYCVSFLGAVASNKILDFKTEMMHRVQTITRFGGKSSSVSGLKGKGGAT